MTTGWLCPKCGSGVAPGVERCPCVPQQFTHPSPGSIYPTTWPAYPTTPVSYPTMWPWTSACGNGTGENPQNEDPKLMYFSGAYDDAHKDDAKVPDFKG